MSEAKFTKGKWVSGVLSIADAEGYSVDCDSDIGYGFVGTRDSCVALVVTKDSDDAELDANISIIESAPEMYNMLELIVELDKLSPHQNDIVNKLLSRARGEHV